MVNKRVRTINGSLEKIEFYIEKGSKWQPESWQHQSRDALCAPLATLLAADHHLSMVSDHDNNNQHN